jgi:hypothetical protein
MVQGCERQERHLGVWWRFADAGYQICAGSKGFAKAHNMYF